MYTKRLRNRVSDADSAGANEDDEETDSSTSDGRVLSSPWHWCEAMHRAAHPSSRGGGVLSSQRCRSSWPGSSWRPTKWSWENSCCRGTRPSAKQEPGRFSSNTRCLVPPAPGLPSDDVVSSPRALRVVPQPSPSPEVEISITSIASAITLETPFPATVTVTNKYAKERKRKRKISRWTNTAFSRGGRGRAGCRDRFCRGCSWPRTTRPMWSPRACPPALYVLPPRHTPHHSRVPHPPQHRTTAHARNWRRYHQAVRRVPRWPSCRCRRAYRPSQASPCSTRRPGASTPVPTTKSSSSSRRSHDHAMSSSLLPS